MYSYLQTLEEHGVASIPVQLVLVLELMIQEVNQLDGEIRRKDMQLAGHLSQSESRQRFLDAKGGGRVR